jgi:hypothetical protein
MSDNFIEVSAIAAWACQHDSRARPEVSCVKPRREKHLIVPKAKNQRPFAGGLKHACGIDNTHPQCR